MIKPTLTTDAAPPERNARGLIVLAGAIKWWWLKKCNRCGRILPEDAEVCTSEYVSAQTGRRMLCNSSSVYELWGNAEHKEYVAWRNFVRSALIDAGWLTYAPHEAFKGTWMPAAQAVNDAAISAANTVLVLSPPNVITDGTDDEVEYAERVGTAVAYAQPGDHAALGKFL